MGNGKSAPSYSRRDDRYNSDGGEMVNKTASDSLDEAIRELREANERAKEYLAELASRNARYASEVGAGNGRAKGDIEIIPSRLGQSIEKREQGTEYSYYKTSGVSEDVYDPGSIRPNSPSKRKERQANRGTNTRGTESNRGGEKSFIQSAANVQVDNGEPAWDDITGVFEVDEGATSPVIEHLRQRRNLAYKLGEMVKSMNELAHFLETHTFLF